MVRQRLRNRFPRPVGSPPEATMRIPTWTAFGSYGIARSHSFALLSSDIKKVALSNIILVNSEFR